MLRAGRAFALAALCTSLTAVGIAADTTTSAAPNPNPNVTLIVGAAAKHNAHGTLSANVDGMSFATKTKTYKVAKASLQKVTVGSDTKETGGLPMTAAKAAVPYGGGRVISLFAHEKFDTLTVEYRDENGGYRGVVFAMPKGQADAMAAAAGDVSTSSPAQPMAAADRATDPGWAIQVEPLDPGDTAVSPAFLVATYEFLIEKLQDSHKFAMVLRSGDANATKYPKLLVLKTNVISFVHGNEEQRAVTTVKGWTKLRVKMDIQTSDRRSVLQKEVESNVRFYGGNMRATQTLASSMGTLASNAKAPE
ncbi:hypothetical protein Acid345_2802 [Candidatus Koribacter versatilis Ellin345]|uniref:DUF4412 domain-containing protein n=1 Tax=Koribacter versatilis (strain Ellin345) TaxID=204669 RepID=Q1IMU7_KORVE|nr:hypothetical protein [Candidatus Koribacter versatilis]ABF41803.1 hypothetical protein Acid345_2802 [Candidatus Koribacter versatilis Ellin345]